MVSDLGKANLAKSGSKPTQYICCSTIPQILYFQQQNISFPACFSFIRSFFPQSTQFLHNSWMTSHWGKSKWISSRRPEQCAWHRATALHQSILYFRSSKDKSLIVYLKYHFSWTSNFEHIWWMKSRRKEFWWEGKWFNAMTADMEARPSMEVRRIEGRMGLRRRCQLKVSEEPTVFSVNQLWTSVWQYWHHRCRCALKCMSEG